MGWEKCLRAHETLKDGTETCKTTWKTTTPAKGETEESTA